MAAGEHTDWRRLRDQLHAAGVAGVEDLGTFVNDTTYFPASKFDERAAMPVLIAALPDITDPKLVSAVAGHLNRAWAKPSAYEPVYRAFRKWAPIHGGAGWALGDTLARVAGIENIEQVLPLVQEIRFGNSRQMIVISLWRYRRDERVENVLRALVTDPDVSLHAISALKRTIGPVALLSALDELLASDPDEQVRAVAVREHRKLRKRLAESST